MCMCWMFYTLTGLKKKSSWALFSGMGQILETHFIYVRQMLRFFSERDFYALRPSCWEDKASGFPGAKRWPILCLPLSSHIFDFSILDQVSSPISCWKRHTLEIRVLVFSRIDYVCTDLFSKVIALHWKRDFLVVKNGNARGLWKVSLPFRYRNRNSD